MYIFYGFSKQANKLRFCKFQFFFGVLYAWGKFSIYVLILKQKADNIILPSVA